MRICLLAVCALLCALPIRAGALPGLPAELQPHVLLYVPFDGTATAAEARGAPEPLVAEGLQFAPGHSGAALAAGKSTRCAYATAGNLEPAQGTIMMWVRRGAGSDALFALGPWYGADFLTWRVCETLNVTCSQLKVGGAFAAALETPGVPPADQWRLLALTWDRKQLRLYENGAQRGGASVSAVLSPAALADRMWIGTSAEGHSPANSLLDDLYILDVPLSADQLAAVADPALAAQLAARAAKRQDGELRTLFHLGFDGADPLRADQAAGNPAPAQHDKLQFVPGLKGKGVLLQGEAVLAYEEPRNLDKDYGSFELWVKFGFDEANPPPYPCFFKEDAPLGPLPVDNIWLFMANQSGFGTIRCDRRVSGMDDVLYASVPGDVVKDTWHQLVLNWDSRVGQRLYVDGQKMPNFVSDRPFGVRGFTWTPQEHPRFFLGSRGRDVYHSAEPMWGACESVIDNFSIYSRPLTPTEVAAHYIAGWDPGSVPPLLLARQAATTAGEPYVPVLDLKNPHDFALTGKLAVTLTGGTAERPVFSGAVTVPPQAQSTVTASPLKLPAGRYGLVYLYNGRKIGQQYLSVLGPPPGQGAGGEPVLVARYDAVAMREAKDSYRESAPSRVGALGEVRYVEAGAPQFARLAFRFAVQHPGQPHLLRVFYPDDRDRAFDLIVNSPHYPCTYDTQGGVLTGREFENTGQLQHYDLLYWPREPDQALFLTTWVQEAPAAISGFEVYELPGLPPPPLAAPSSGGRRLGLYWEDMMLSEAFGGRQRETDGTRFAGDLADRMIATMRATGQNELIYPICFYQGPSYLSLADNLIAGGGQRHPQEYVDILLRRFAQAGAPGEFGLLPSLNCCLSPSLLLPVEKYVKTPEAGYLRVDNQGNMQSGQYPQLNPFHPLYQERFTAIVREMCARWGKSPAFEGLQLHLVAESSFWLADARWGYDDFTVGLFEQDSGIKLPPFAGDDRYAQRYAWLMKEKKSEWLDWRCRKLAQFYTRLARLLTDTRPDLKLVIGLRYMAEGDGALPLWEQSGRSMKTLYRGAGLDFDLLARIPNVEIQKYFFPSDIAWRRLGATGNAVYNGLELRRSGELHDTLTRGGRQAVSVNQHIEYFESDIDAREPIKDLWWEGPGWRVAGLMPGGRHWLELFAEAVALYDAPRVTIGGFIVGTMGHQEEITEFARAYRPLPAVQFDTLKGASDTAVVRVGPGGYLYAVSRSPFPVTVDLQCPADVTLTDLSDNAQLKGPTVRLALGPYQLRSFRGKVTAANVSIAGYGLPPERRSQVQAAMARLRAQGPGGAAIAERLRTELEQLNYTRCRFILQEPATLDLLERQQAAQG